MGAWTAGDLTLAASRHTCLSSVTPSITPSRSENLTRLNINAWSNSAPNEDVAEQGVSPIRLPPRLPHGLTRLKSLGLKISDPHDLAVSPSWFCFGFRAGSAQGSGFRHCQGCCFTHSAPLPLRVHAQALSCMTCIEELVVCVDVAPPMNEGDDPHGDELHGGGMGAGNPLSNLPPVSLRGLIAMITYGL